MSNAKDTKSNSTISQPKKVTAVSRSEVNASQSQDLRNKVNKLVAMPADAVRAALAKSNITAVSAKVAYDVISRFLSLLETGTVIDKATLQTTKAAIDRAHAGDAITLFNIGKAFAQVTHLNDVLTRIVSYHRTYADSTHSSDQPAKTLTKAPRQDTAHSSDTRTKSVGKPKTDTLTLAESFKRVVTFNRLPNDQTHFIDTKAIAFTKGAQAQTAHASDSAPKTLLKPKFDTAHSTDLKTIGFFKAANEIMRSSDAKTVKFTKAINDYIHAFTDATTLYNYSSSKLELSHVADNLTRLVSFNRTFKDTARTTEVLARVLSKPRKETIISADRVTTLKTFIRLFTDSSHSSDVFKRVVSFNRTRTDTAAATETHAKSFSKGTLSQTARSSDSYTRTITKAKADTSHASDSFSRLVSYHKNLSSTATSTHSIDVIALTKSFVRTFRDNTHSTDNFTKTVGYKRFFTETAHSSDVFSKVVAYRRLSADITHATDAFTKVVTFRRLPADTAHASETFVRTVNKSLSETARSVDKITAKVFLKKLADLVSADDNFTISTFTHPGVFPPADKSRIGDLFQKVVSFVRLPADTARSTDTIGKGYAKTAGERANSVWADFAELSYTYELTQAYPHYRVEWLATSDDRSKNVSKNLPAGLGQVYYTKPLFNDFAELTLGTVVDQDLVQSFSSAYFSPSFIASAADTVTKILTYRRAAADTFSGTDTLGKVIARTVGDTKYGVFTDVAELYYSSEFTSGAGGYGASVTLTNTYPTYSVAIVSGGASYTVGQSITLNVPTGTCTVTVTAIDGNGAITSLSSSTTATRVTTQSAYLLDFVDLTFGTTNDQDLRFVSQLAYSYPGPYTLAVGADAPQKRNVIGQDLLFTLNQTAEGDTTRVADKPAKTISKIAKQFLPQGFWTDYNDLTFASGTGLDQDLTQNLARYKDETVSAAAVLSMVTKGPIKGVTDTTRATDLAPKTVSKGTNADTAHSSDTFAKTYSMSAGKYVNTSWRDYVEFQSYSALAEMPLVYEGKFELIQVKESLAKTYSKSMTFPYYVWRDYNELSFAQSLDQDLAFTWARTDTSDISRATDNLTRVISPKKVDTLTLVETFGKTVSTSVGDTRTYSLNDFLGLLPTSYNPTGNASQQPNAVQDQELLFTLTGGPRYDNTSATDAAPKQFNKFVNRKVDPFWHDYNDLSFGTAYDQDLVQYQSTVRPETAVAADIFKRTANYIRAFSDSIHISDTILLQVNGGPFFTRITRGNDITHSADNKANTLYKSAGDNRSMYSLWYDFPELTISADMAQYFSTPPDSATDISRMIDKKTNFLTKQAGRVQNIMNTFDVDLYFNQDLVQIFDNSYVTEIIIPADQLTKRYGKSYNENLHFVETYPKFFYKNALGSTTTNDALKYNPLFINYFDLFDESLGGAYPNYKIEIARATDAAPRYITKTAGNNSYLSWIDSGEITSYDVTLQTYGAITEIVNPPRTTYDRYLDNLVFAETEELSKTPYRDELVNVSEIFRKVVTFRRLPSEVQRASDFAPWTLSKPKNEIIAIAEQRTKQYTKAGGQLYWSWTDYNELNFSNDLTQQLSAQRLEIITAVETFAKTQNKPSPDTVRSADLALKTFGKNKNENLRMVETIGKNINIAQVGNSTSTFWFDLGEITSYDVALQTYGYMKTTKFDVARTFDSSSRQYNVAAGTYRTRIWGDFAELDYYNEITNSWTPFTTEYMVAMDTAKRNLNKGLQENPRSVDSGTVRNFKSDSYIIDSSPYFASDYLSDGIVTSTF